MTRLQTQTPLICITAPHSRFIFITLATHFWFYVSHSRKVLQHLARFEGVVYNEWQWTNKEDKNPPQTRTHTEESTQGLQSPQLCEET